MVVVVKDFGEIHLGQLVDTFHHNTRHQQRYLVDSVEVVEQDQFVVEVVVGIPVVRVRQEIQPQYQTEQVVVDHTSVVVEQLLQLPMEIMKHYLPSAEVQLQQLDITVGQDT